MPPMSLRFCQPIRVGAALACSDGANPVRSMDARSMAITTTWFHVAVMAIVIDLLIFDLTYVFASLPSILLSLASVHTGTVADNVTRTLRPKSGC
jgi:hypothetical protein